MLIEFKVTNFRSIREEQTFSLVASNTDKDLPACVIDRALPGLSGVKFLKGAAIYGANASGKSNVLAAVAYAGGFVERSATRLQPGDKTGAEPFKLDTQSATRPSEFEFTFVADGVRFVFGFAATPQRVVEEYLVAYPKGVPQRWYQRTFNASKGSYDWAKPSTAFDQDQTLQDKTRENSLFLSVGPQFNHRQLTQVFNWFKSSLYFIPLSAESGSLSDLVATVRQITKATHRDRIIHLLRSADFGVVDANLKTKDITGVEELLEELTKSVSPSVVHAGVENIPRSADEELTRSVSASAVLAKLAKLEKENGLETGKNLEINLTHKAEGIQPVALDFHDEESAGTRRFFALLGPWLDILDNGYTVFIDEIETSLHPVLVKELLKLLLCSKNNPNGAQVVFTTHNPVLLDSTLMRRDQVWFTEKSSTGATHLYPLTDYQPRRDEAREKGYLAGRYGAIPFLPEGLKL
jgi:uncharacterized protein